MNYAQRLRHFPRPLLLWPQYPSLEKRPLNPFWAPIPVLGQLLPSKLPLGPPIPAFGQNMPPKLIHRVASLTNISFCQDLVPRFQLGPHPSFGPSFGRLIFYHYWCWRAGGATPVKTSTGNNNCQRPHLVGTILLFKMSKSRGREEKLRQKRQKEERRKNLETWKTPTNLRGFFLANYHYKTGEKLRFLTKMCPPVGVSP